MIRFVITSHDHLPGVRLSMAGSWVNVPFPDEAAARDAAKWHARGRSGTIKRVHYPALPGCEAIKRGL